MKWILSDPGALVGFSSFMATFIASVMADEQNDRLRQGTFGAIAGTSVGGLASLIQKDSNLLLIGVFGSAVGAIAGWIVYLLMSVIASQKWGRRLIEYHVGGLNAVRNRIDLDDRNQILLALNVWSQNFRGMVLREMALILSIPKSSEYDRWSEVVIRAWLTSLIDAFNLVLDAIAEKREYRSRITLIVFGKKSGRIVGKHWIAYAGPSQSHKLREFGTDSIAYKVISNEKNSPCFATMKAVNRGEGEDREAANRQEGDKGESSETNSEKTSTYLSFIVFRVNDDAVLSLDWPGKISEEDQYVSVAKSLLTLDVGPAIGKLLDHRTTPIATEVCLKPVDDSGDGSGGTSAPVAR